LGVQVFLNDCNFLFGYSLLSLLIKHCLFFEEDLLVVMFFDPDFGKDFTWFFVGLSVVNFESIQDPLDVIAFLAEDHSLLVFRLYCEFELELLNAVGLEGDGNAFDPALVRDFLVAAVVQALLHHLFVNLDLCQCGECLSGLFPFSGFGMLKQVLLEVVDTVTRSG
jgi:hypothetical protein